MLKKEPGNLFAEMVRMLVSVIEEKDVYIKGHSERVAVGCLRFAQKLNLGKDDTNNLYIAGLLHDIGMVYIPLEIVQKPEKLTADEMAMVKKHPVIAENIFSKVSVLKSILPVIRHHHEAFDGSGYPDALKGDGIPLEARIFSLVNSYDAMISARAHRKAFNRENALENIKQNAGLHFDPRLADEFCKFVNSSSKIFESASLDKDVKKNRATQSLMTAVNDIIKRFQTGNIDLPVLPKIIHDIQKVINKPESNVDDLAAIIEKDAVISIRLISVANTPMYRGAEKITTVSQAVPRLGMKETRNIVSAIANKSIYKTNDPQLKLLMEKLWLHSLSCAYASRVLAQKLALEDQEKFFLMGLTHDIGKALLLNALTTMYAQIETVDIVDIISGIQEVHTSFSSIILQRSRFSSDFIKVAKFHEEPEFSTTTKGILVVHLANNLTRKIGYSLFNDDELDLSALESAKLLGVDSNTLDEVAEEVKRMMQDSANIY